MSILPISLCATVRKYGQAGLSKLTTYQTIVMFISCNHFNFSKNPQKSLTIITSYDTIIA